MSLEKYELINTEYKISTQVKIAEINSCVDTGLVFKYLEHYPCGNLKSEQCPTCYKNLNKKTVNEPVKHPIQSICYKPKPDEKHWKGKPEKEKAVRKNSKKKKTFWHQVTVNISPIPGRVISTKLYVNGTVQMAGCKSEEESIKTVEILINELKKIGKIKEPGELSINLSPLEYNDIMKQKEKMNEDEWRRFLLALKKEKTTVKKTGAKKGRKKKNAVKEVIPVEKIPVNYDIKYIRKTVEFPNELKIVKMGTYLINSDFKFMLKNNETGIVDNFSLNREKLIEVLTDKFGQICMPFNKSRYPGVNIKFVSSVDCDKNCAYMSSEAKECAFNAKKNKNKNKNKDKDNECAEIKNCVSVSVFCFQQGTVILTGARSLKQIEDTYKFITDVVRENLNVLNNDSKLLDDNGDLSDASYDSCVSIA
jgi:TATA-box binding protein (TBP) (component of TFIID and TFIIIB)